MNNKLTIGDTAYTLFRFPKGTHDKSLQAWDSADELLVNYILQTEEPKTNPVILNDQFGTIAIGLHNLTPLVVTDSKISELALKQNSTLNKLPASNIIPATHELPFSDLYLIKLTKNLTYLEFQLQQINSVNPDAKIIAAGKTTQVTSSVLAIFERYYNHVKTSLAKKKSRLIFADEFIKQKENKVAKYKTISWLNEQLTITSLPNVFSRDKIDIGGRFLAENLPKITNSQSIVDLGCGNGLLGVTLLHKAEQQNKIINLTFVDESYMAVASAQKNVQDNFSLNLQKNISYQVSDCLTDVKTETIDLILCNPPFHQQNTITEHIARQMFDDAHRCLVSKGELYVVANRHLGYQAYLKQRFSRVNIHKQNQKFIIYVCIKEGSNAT